MMIMKRETRREYVLWFINNETNVEADVYQL